MEGIWLPAEVWELDLPPLHRVFLARLIALSKQDGASWAGDEFLAESLRCTPQHVRKMRRQLEESGHIVTEGYGHKRRLSVELAPVGAKVAPVGTSNQRRKQPEAQELQPEAQKLRLQMRQEATTDAESIEENRTSKELVKKEPKPKIEIVMPWESDEFASAWREWKEYKRVEKRFTFKSPKTEQTALHKIHQDAEGNEHLAVFAIATSIANGWSGIFINAQLKREFSKREGSRGSDELTPEYLHWVKTGEWLPHSV
jgi:hypothetical protein